MARTLTAFGVEILASEVNDCGDLDDYFYMTTIPIIFRLAQGLYALLNQQIDRETLNEHGIAHAIFDAVGKRDHTNWEIVAEEFRNRHRIPKGTGYGKEAE